MVDEIVSYEECIAMSDMIVVAVPVSIAIRMIPDILDKVDRQVVTDVCSTKEKINDMVRYHPNRKNFVAAHPMAGTEYFEALNVPFGISSIPLPFNPKTDT